MGDKQEVLVSSVLNLVSPISLQPYIDKYKADFSANKLHTIVLVKLFLYSWLLNQEWMTLRSISTNSESPTFKQLANLDPNFSIKKSSLSERLAKIPWPMFEELFEELVQRAFATIPTKKRAASKVVNQLLASAHILDSTIITLSIKLLKAGFSVNEGSLTIKASIAICGKQIPVKALVFTEKTYASEDQALPKLMNLKENNIIYLFDRGVQRLLTYAEIAKSGNFFISRLTAKNYQVKQQRELPKTKETETLTILSDEIITFPQLKDQTLEFRLITAKSKKNSQTLRFITNLINIEATDITEVYRYRWSIEVFFRFLKTELHLEGLLSYSENGMKVHIYLTLISFLLTWTYKERNKIKSFRRARQLLSWNLLDLLMQRQYQKGILLGVTLRELAIGSDNTSWEIPDSVE